MDIKLKIKEMVKANHEKINKRVQEVMINREKSKIALSTELGRLEFSNRNSKKMLEYINKSIQLLLDNKLRYENKIIENDEKIRKL
jgi:hypothetical protein